MRSVRLLILLVLVACNGKSASPTNSAKADPCAAFAQREMTCIGLPEMKRGDAAYDLVYDTCVDPEADPKVTKTLLIGASMGERLVSLDDMIACAQKPLDCTAYTACFGGQRTAKP